VCGSELFYYVSFVCDYRIAILGFHSLRSFLRYLANSIASSEIRVSTYHLLAYRLAFACFVWRKREARAVRLMYVVKGVIWYRVLYR
jgi:hypothetical protein